MTHLFQLMTLVERGESLDEDSSSPWYKACNTVTAVLRDCPNWEGIVRSRFQDGHLSVFQLCKAPSNKLVVVLENKLGVFVNTIPICITHSI